VSVRERGRRALERLVAASAVERALISLASLVLAVAIGTVIILVAGRMTTCDAAAFVLTHPTSVGVPGLFRVGIPELFRMGFCHDPVTVFDRLFLGALADPLSPGWDPLDGQIAVTLRETTVLVFTGLSVALAFRAGIFNIGTQGQMVVGALATALLVLWVAPLVSGVVGAVLLVPFGLLVGAAFGGFYGAIPGALKAYADANEVITTIMLNFIATGVVLFLVSEVFKDPASQANQTVPLPDDALFPPVLFGGRFGFSILALVFALAAVLALAYLLSRTSFGYDIRTSGVQPQAAEYGGVDARRTIVASMTLSGALGGLAGAVYVLMILGNFETGVPAYGFDGITVAILAGNNPLGVPFAALLFGVLKSGTTVVQFATDVPPQLVGVLRGLIILFVAMPEFFRMLGRRVVPPERGRPTEPGTAATDGGRFRGDDARPADGEQVRGGGGDAVDGPGRDPGGERE
jgi:simple sugar transport system permease protein